ncbi:MAG: hypothetical protein J6D03_00685 [Clostridia bacterium]|nr:hypothetical protein [Clostridia bacterium]
MGREYIPKKITLFNKNHVSLICTYMRYQVIKNTIAENDNSSWHSRIKANNWYNKRWVPKKTIVEEKESPLGFVYKKKTVIPEHWESLVHRQDEGEMLRPIFKSYTIKIRDKMYCLAYPYSVNNVVGKVIIGQDIRPWELIDKTSMSDHYVDDLYKIMLEFFSIIKNSSPIYRIDKFNNDKLIPFDIDTFIRVINTDLFGSGKGPRYQTNDEKIMAHGFDLKSSFRKDKENK